MNKLIPFACLICVSTWFLSCGSGINQDKNTYSSDSAFKKGKVIPVVECLSDPSVTYSLYLPSSYTKLDKFPVIITFDPHASGSLPLDKYQKLAEIYQFILIGSNTSKNGLPAAEINRIITALFNDVRSRFAIDTNQIYTMGFSGGSRVASLAGLLRKDIAGVIGIGAGFPSTGQPLTPAFSYIGFVGNADFNMREMIFLDKELDKTNIQHALVIFEGTHEWPPLNVMDKAFIWSRFDAMKKNIKPKDNRLIESYIIIMEEDMQAVAEQGSMMNQYRMLKEMTCFLDGLSDISGYKQELKEIESQDSYRIEQRKFQALLEEEAKVEQNLSENFFRKDITSWEQDKKKLESDIIKGQNNDEAKMKKRILSYLSLLAYMNYTQSKDAGDNEKADFAFRVYQIVDPENAAKIK